jgi:hypothetical protein
MRYDVAGADVSAGYNFRSPNSTIVATVYVYPAPPLVSIGSPSDVVQSARATLCNSEFARRKNEITAAHRDARLLSEGNAVRPHSGPPVLGKVAEYEFSAPNREPLRSGIFVYCYIGDKWAFEYRFTSQKFPDASEQISAFMKALPWTIPEKP